MSGRMAMYSNLKLLIVIILIIFMVSCSSPSRFRVLIGNGTGEQIACSGYFYSQPCEIANRGFDELFKAGKKAKLRNGEWIVIKRPTIIDYNYFWVGIKNSLDDHWVLNEKFEEYNRYWLDISEGLRIDYTIEPNGEIKKRYWGD